MAPGLVIVSILVLVAGALELVRRLGKNWGASLHERLVPMTGDDWLDGDAVPRMRMTRAVTIRATPEAVWPWLAQLGRGAGWYSFDLLDNGGRTSARHVVSWIPEPARGDAASIGYLRHLEEGRELVWWTPGTHFLGTFARSVMAYRIDARGDDTRLVFRVTANVRGSLAAFVRWAFPLIDSLMAVRQLVNLKERVERFGTRTAEQEETGARDQFQLYHAIYASGEEAGVAGKEAARESRRAALADGVLRERDTAERAPW